MEGAIVKGYLAWEKDTMHGVWDETHQADPSVGNITSELKAYLEDLGFIAEVKVDWKK